MLNTTSYMIFKAFKQEKSFKVSAGVQKENPVRVQKEKLLQGVTSQDFRPGVVRWGGRLRHGPEPA